MENKKKLIALVDDNPKNLQVLASTLDDADFKPALFTTGDQLLEYLETTIPDLILLDILMPDKDGYEICREIKAQKFYKDIPIIFITAKNEIHDIVKGFEAGAVDYISKPFNKAELLARVSTHVELNSARKEITELSAMKDKMFSLVVHDLRSPFTAIMGLSDVIVNDFEDLSISEIRQIGESIFKSSKGAIGLIENLLEWAKMQLNKISFEPKSVKLNDCIKNTLELSEIYSEKKQINIVDNISPELVVIADTSLLNTIIRNLLSNAIKFSEPQSDIIVSARLVNHYAEISVKDNGVGISTENISKLFNQNSYFSTKGTMNEKGSGIGLYLCKELVEKQSGKIWVKSELKKGSEFVFTLPVNNDFKVS